MPQMAPMGWLVLLTMITGFMFILYSKVYFFEFNQSKVSGLGGLKEKELKW